MALTGLGTSSREEKAAMWIGVDDRRVELTQVQVADRSEAEIKLELESAASLSDVELPRFFVHVNLDGSIALATGEEPDVWPEDWSDPLERERER